MPSSTREAASSKMQIQEKVLAALRRVADTSAISRLRVERCGVPD